MGMEIGGRSDKRGNGYENRYLVNLLLRLVDEKLSSIIIEPVGENSAEFIAETTDGKKIYYQCKASNGQADHWRVSDLKKHDVWKRAKEIILSDDANYYYFVSPVPYDDIDEICYRARTNSEVTEFFEKQIDDKHHSDLVSKIASEFQLDIEKEKDKNTLVYILSHCFFELVPKTRDAVLNLESQVGVHFAGDQKAARILLEQFANSSEAYGVKFIPVDVVNYMRKKQFELRSYRFDDRIFPKVEKLNEIYWGTFPAINGTLIHREATEQVLEKLDLGYSIVLHGRAGSGKSGCLQEVIEELKRRGTPYLSIKLDKCDPDSSANQFGKSLDLQESPVFALNGISGGKPCVLIFDQLDALRWTATHSSNALSVCKEMIGQMQAINRRKEGKISILFASRTVDLENDAGIKELFREDEEHKDDLWEQVKVDILTPSEVENVVGKRFNNMSPRLKKILQTPSSLYVWTQLNDEDKNRDISSVFQLMQRWWEQILAKSEESGVKSEIADKTKNKLVSYIESNNITAVPRVLLPSYADVLEIFLSCGLILKVGNGVTFAHQSVFDYFITQAFLDKVFSGNSIVECISPYEQQTPQRRYHLLYVLQVLLETDSSLFIKQSENLLCSETVHYYYKCAVFEVAGQCDDPNDQLFAFISKYYFLPEWSETVFQSVILRHPGFVKKLLHEIDLGDEKQLVLLQSISDKDTDFVMECLKGMKIDSLEDARRVFSVFPYDPSNDSNAMFQYRLELLSRFPEIFNNFLLFPRLIKKQPEKAIDFLIALLNSESSGKIDKLYIGEKKDIASFSKAYYQEVIEKILPVIKEQTSDLVLSWPFSIYSDECKRFEDWFQEGRTLFSTEHPVRTVVNITIAAAEECARQKPEEIISLANEKNDSAVCHEIIAHGLLCLDESFSDFVINWLLIDFNNRMFVFTGDEKDYLLYTKQAFSKFTPCCSASLFRMLENVICQWDEGPGEMVKMLRRRQEVNSWKQYEPVYYAYWGHLQKELLASMDSARLSQYAQELLAVLIRNEWVRSPHFCGGTSVGMAKSVVSPVDNYVDRLSDKTWLTIINTPDEKMNGHFRGKEDEEHYIEASPEMFSSSMRKQAKKQPERFAKLSLAFPENCYHGYICAVLDAISYPIEGGKQIEDDLLLNRLIGRFCVSTDRNVLTSVSRVVENCKINWDPNIIDAICEIALNYATERNASFTVTDSRDPSHLSARSLLENAINTTRGCAVKALSSQLWENPVLADKLKPVVTALCSDKNEIVRFAAFDCLLPLYNIDPCFSVEQMKMLIQQDGRICFAPGFWDLMIRDYENNPQFYQERLIKACSSGVEDLSETAAGMLASLVIQGQTGNELSILEKMDYSEEQANSIARQAVAFYDNEKYHERSEEVLRLLISKTNCELRALLSLFYHKKIIADRDGEFLKYVISSEQNRYILPEMLDYFNEYDGDLTAFCEVFADIAINLDDEYAVWRQQSVAENLIGCTLKLLDQGGADDHVREVCLSLWDALYKSNLQSMQALSKTIEELSIE